MIRCFVLCFFVFILTECNNTNNKETNNEPVYEKGSYGYDAAFLKKHGYDFKKDVLTILIPEIHKDGMYVNSKWELQKQPFSGDVINSYNDGPLQDGSQMGPFYEIESSSPAKELKPGEIQEYHQTTIHLQGAYSSLKTLVQQLIHVDLEDVKKW